MTYKQQEIWTPTDMTWFGPHTRNLALWGEINEEVSLSFISQLLELVSEYPEQPITIYLNTPGGSFMDSYAIYDTIKSLPCHVTIIATGLCASAGLTILSAADTKLATKNTIFFYHQTILKGNKEFDSIESTIGTAEAYKLCHDMYDTNLIKTTKITRAKWEEEFKNKTVKYFLLRKPLSSVLLISL